MTAHVIATGTRLSSQVCTTQVIVVRPPSEPVKLTCGGREMVALDGAAAPATGAPAPGFETGALLGKRYATADGTVELLVTRAGAGSLAVDGAVLAEKAARPLPASD